jgi:hypothetical protein
LEDAEFKCSFNKLIEAEDVNDGTPQGTTEADDINVDDDTLQGTIEPDDINAQNYVNM